MRLLLLLLLTNPIFAQTGVRYDNYNITSANNYPFGAQTPVFTMPNSTVTICSYPDDGGQPCGNVINVYSDHALTQVVQQPLVADTHGRFGFWLAPGTYTYSVVTAGGQFAGTYIFTLGGSGGGSGCTVPGVSGAVLYDDGAGHCTGTANATLNANGFLHINPVGGTGYVQIDATNNPTTGQDYTVMNGQQLIVQSSGGGEPAYGSNLSGIVMHQSDISYPSGGLLQGLYAFDAFFSVNRAGKDGDGYHTEPDIGPVTVGTISQFTATQPSVNIGSHITNFYDFHSINSGNSATPALTTTENFAFFADVQSIGNPINSDYCDFYGRSNDGGGNHTLRESIGCGQSATSTFTGPVILHLYTPASSSAACTAGQIADDTNYHYVCVATNTWKRVALTSF